MTILPLFLIAILLIVSSINCESNKTINYSLAANESAVFDCSSMKGSVKFSFYSHNIPKTLIENENNTENVQINGNVLTIKKMSKDDIDKTFVCDSNDDNSTIFDKHPQFQADKIQEGKINMLSSSFRLVITLNTKNANCTWKFQSKDGNETVKIESNAKYSFINSTLTINKPDKDDSGLYLCELENDYGRNYKLVDVNITSELMSFWVFCIVLLQVVLGSLMLLFCEKRSLKKESSTEYSFEQAHLQNKQNMVA